MQASGVDKTLNFIYYFIAITLCNLAYNFVIV